MKTYVVLFALLFAFSQTHAAEIDEKEIDRFVDLFFIKQDIKAVQEMIDAKDAKPARGMKPGALAEHWIKELKESKLKFTLKPKRLFKVDELPAITKELNLRNAAEPALKETLSNGIGCAAVMSYEQSGRKRERASIFVFHADAAGKTRIIFITD